MYLHSKNFLKKQCFTQIRSLSLRQHFYEISSNNRTVVRYRETKNAKQDESRLRGQGLSSESVVCRHLSRPKGPGNPLPSDEFIGNLWRGTGDAKDLLFLLNLAVYARGRGGVKVWEG